MIFYSDKAKGAYKLKMTPFIIINPKFKEDKDLINHEREHVFQWVLCAALTIPLLFVSWGFLLLSIMLHDLLYTFVKHYRQWAEVRAFKAQLKSGKGDINIAANLLATDYDLGITVEKAKELLR